MMTMALILLSTAFVCADGPKPESSISNPFVVLMVIIILFLALIIAILARLVTGAAAIKAEKEKQGKSLQAKATTIISMVLLFLSVGVFAQDKPAEAAAAVTDGTINGLAPLAYYSIVSVAFLELLVIIVLTLMLKTFLAAEKQSIVLAGSGAEIAKESWWDNFNKFKPIHQEATIDLGHDYDGIRELDNRLPPWWLYGFYVSILFAFVYLYRYHVAHSAPLPREQYALDVAAADRAKADYLKKAANNVDETSVKLLTDNTNLAAGKQIFETSCFPCHGKLGEGLVGPNLTDDYWLHGGSINDVFKTIKYGYPEKGMKSWKDDFSPVQIAQVASYIKSLHGTNPPNAKPAQGTIYKDDQSAGGTASPVDSVKKDTTVVAQH